MQIDRLGRVIPFLNEPSSNSTAKHQPKKHSAETSSARSTRSQGPRLPLIELCEGPTRSQVLLRAIDRLHRLDTEQIQIAEIVIAAIARGQL